MGTKLQNLFRRHGRLAGVPTNRVRLFMSLDLVGSTAHKQRSVRSDGAEHAHPWLKPFTEFFPKVEQYLKDEWEALPERLARCPIGFDISQAKRPKFWKGIGDEAVYEAELVDRRVATLYLAVLRRVLAHLQRDLGQVQLSVKASAWLADFPVTNSEVILGERRDRLLDDLVPYDDWFLRHFARAHLYELCPNPAEFRDYLGPQMDVGFRLGSQASPRRISLSLDLAWALACHHTDWAAVGFDEGAQLHFLAETVLKGVLGGVPYPVFWLDALADAERIRHQARDRIHGASALDSEEVRRYAEEFVGHHTDRFPWLGLPCDGKDEAALTGNYHQRRLVALNQQWCATVKRWCQASKVAAGVSAGNPGARATVEAFLDKVIPTGA